MFGRWSVWIHVSQITLVFRCSILLHSGDCNTQVVFVFLHTVQVCSMIMMSGAHIPTVYASASC